MVGRSSGRRLVPILGVDVGGVVVALSEGDEDTSFFGNRPLETPAVAGVFEALAALARDPFEGRIHIVSKAGPKVAANTRAWLVHNNFFERTGIAESDVHFVRERRDKAPVCARLAVTHFIDDRLDVLAYLTTVRHRYLFLGGRRDGVVPSPGQLPEGVSSVVDWSEVASRIQAG